MRIKSQVTTFPAASSENTLAHFEARLSFETDCWDVNHSIENGVANFVHLSPSATGLIRSRMFPCRALPNFDCR